MHNDLRRYSISKLGQSASSSDRALLSCPSTGNSKTPHNVSGSQYPPIRPRPTTAATSPNSLGADQYVGSQSTETSIAIPHGSVSDLPLSVPNCSWSTILPSGNPEDAVFAHEHHAQYGQSLYSHAVQQPSDYGPTNGQEHSSYFPGLSPLARHLPQPALGRSRVLPLPPDVRSLDNEPCAPTHPTGSGCFSNPTQDPTARGSESWSVEHILPETIQRSGASGSCEDTDPVSSTPIETRETSTFGYPGSSHTVNYSSSSPTTTIEQAATLFGTTASNQVGLPTLSSSYASTNYSNTGAPQDSYSVTNCPDSCLPTSGQCILQPQPRRPQARDVFHNR